MSRSLRNVEAALRRAWHPLCRSSEVTERPRAATLMGEHYVAYRVASGELRVIFGRCPYRFAPLSLGACEGNQLRCAYHGWVFDEQGHCLEIPSINPGDTLPVRAKLSEPFAVAESHSMVFVAPDDPLTPLPTLKVRRLVDILVDTGCLRTKSADFDFGLSI